MSDIGNDIDKIKDFVYYDKNKNTALSRMGAAVLANLVFGGIGFAYGQMSHDIAIVNLSYIGVCFIVFSSVYFACLFIANCYMRFKYRSRYIHTALSHVFGFGILTIFSCQNAQLVTPLSLPLSLTIIIAVLISVVLQFIVTLKNIRKGFYRGKDCGVNQTDKVSTLPFATLGMVLAYGFGPLLGAFFGILLICALGLGLAIVFSIGLTDFLKYYYIKKYNIEPPENLCELDGHYK